MQSLQIISQTLELGSSGLDVVRIQQRLQDLGFNPGTIDGIFSKTTQLAVIKFQISKNLQSDGIVGIQTLAKLFPIEGRKVKTPSGLVFDIIDGANSNDKRLQQFLPLQPFRNGYNLPRFYISIQSFEELKQLNYLL
jgi:peptidoglycan hydrolase-like protein with peptidoglycan-binding domain